MPHEEGTLARWKYNFSIRPGWLHVVGDPVGRSGARTRHPSPDRSVRRCLFPTRSSSRRSSRDPPRLRHPVRHPAARGRLAAGIIEADDLGTYVVKFRGAGQGLRVLVAEVLVGELARRLGIRVPSLPSTSTARDREVRGGRGGPGPAHREPRPQPRQSTSCPAPSGTTPRPVRRRRGAAAILWLDAFVANVDRSWRNPNLLVWHGKVWAIDHGAALYFHHGWPNG